MKIAIIQVPYHLQHENEGMGAGPRRLVEAGAAELLREHGHDATVDVVRLDAPAETPEQASAELNAKLGAKVAAATADGVFPIVFSGNCNSALGTLAGLGGAGTGIVWFDAHGDYNTPDTTVSGFFDGMALAIANGQCHEDLRRRVGLHNPVPDADTILCGVRDLDPAEADLLMTTRVQVLPSADLHRHGLEVALTPTLDRLRSRVDGVYLHLDVDVLDPTEAPANEYNTIPGGLTVAELAAAIRLIAARFEIRAAAITAFNPAMDPDEKTVRAVFRLLAVIAALLPGE